MKVNYPDDPEFKGAATAGLLRLFAYLFSSRTKEALTKYRELALGTYESWKRWQKFPPGPDRARALHRSIDKCVKESFLKHPEDRASIPCQKGCSHCCQFEVFVNEDETLLLEELVRSGISIDMDRLKIQAETPDFYSLPKETRSCVFLGEGGVCRVYEDRPASCRKHFVRTPVELCKDISNNVEHMILSKAEMITSGAMNLDREPGSLAKKLFRRINGGDSEK